MRLRARQNDKTVVSSASVVSPEDDGHLGLGAGLRPLPARVLRLGWKRSMMSADCRTAVPTVMMTTGLMPRQCPLGWCGCGLRGPARAIRSGFL